MNEKKYLRLPTDFNREINVKFLLQSRNYGRSADNFTSLRQTLFCFICLSTVPSHLEVALNAMD